MATALEYTRIALVPLSTTKTASTRRALMVARRLYYAIIYIMHIAFGIWRPIFGDNGCDGMRVGHIYWGCII